MNHQWIHHSSHQSILFSLTFLLPCPPYPPRIVFRRVSFSDPTIVFLVYVFSRYVVSLPRWSACTHNIYTYSFVSLRFTHSTHSLDTHNRLSQYQQKDTYDVGQTYQRHRRVNVEHSKPLLQMRRANRSYV